MDRAGLCLVFGARMMKWPAERNIRGVKTIFLADKCKSLLAANLLYKLGPV